MPTVYWEPDPYVIRYHLSCLERFDLQKKLKKLRKFLCFLIVLSGARRRLESSDSRARMRRTMGIIMIYRYIKKIQAQLEISIAMQPSKRMRVQNESFSELPSDLERVGQIQALSSMRKVSAGHALTVDYSTWMADLDIETAWYLELNHSSDHSSIPSCAVLLKAIPHGPSAAAEVAGLVGNHLRVNFKGTEICINGDDQPIITFGRDAAIDTLLSKGVESFTQEEQNSHCEQMRSHLVGAAICVPRSRAFRTREI